MLYCYRFKESRLRGRPRATTSKAYAGERRNVRDSDFKLAASVALARV